MAAAGGAADAETYVDDVFSTFLYDGNQTARSINNGIDLASKGGLVWTKRRSGSGNHTFYDTERGATKYIRSNLDNAEGTDSNTLTSFNSNGFSLGTDTTSNDSGTFASWTFRKAKGFFDVVTYTGNETALRNISHSLGCEPGLILIKRTDSTGNWWVYHRDLGDTDSNYSKAIKLNDSGSRFDDYKIGNRSKNTSTTFMVGNDPQVNGTGTYVAYLFAGGESTAATARSVDFDGSGDYLGWAATSDFAFGTGAYTVEFWVYPDSLGNTTFFNVAATNGFAVTIKSDNVTITKYGTSNLVETSVAPLIGQWTHYALVREGTGSNQTKIYKNGILEKTGTDSTDWTVTAATGLGANAAGEGKEWDGKISNFRVVKGTAVYTSSFRTPTEPLTNITNTVLLCCNDSSTTGSSVTPGTITANGDPTASSDSPFADSTGFVFGENKDQEVIKCGIYSGTGSAGHKIELGWEPSFIMFKRITGGTANWEIIDVMRGNPASDGTSQDGNFVRANTNGSEFTNRPFSPYSTGFDIRNGGGGSNASGSDYIYMAIRRSDGYVGKPIELGTDVFGMAYGTGTTPAFAPGFPVDFTFLRRPDTTENWTAATRLRTGKYLHVNESNAESNDTNIVFDYNNGFHDGSGFSNYLSWSWKRHAGFDVVPWKSGGSGESHTHGLNKAPEMIWIKNLSSSALWRGGHKGLNGGTNPWTYGFTLNADSAEFQEVGTFWNGVVPSATSFSTGSAADAGGTSGDYYVAMLFASTDVSKVGYYTGTGSSNSQTITLGFQPRFVLFKRVNAAEDWFMFDSVRGMGSGNDPYLRINKTNDQGSSYNILEATSTGFVLQANMSGPELNNNNDRFIYYAHA